MNLFASVQAVTEMSQVQADVSENFFKEDEDAPISAKDVSKRLTSEVKKAAERKVEKQKVSTSQKKAISLRKQINIKLAPHYHGEVIIPIPYLSPPDPRVANRDYSVQHVMKLQKNMEEAGPNYPHKSVVVCVFEVRFTYLSEILFS